MSEQHASTRPVRCSECSKPLESPICCTRCGTLNPVEPGDYDYFELFGLQPAYQIDQTELRRKYLALARSIHPDVAGRDTEEVRQRALSHSSHLNRAYETLRDPVSRAEYLLNLAASQAGQMVQDRGVPGPLLAEVMTLRERIDEAQDRGDRSALAALRREIVARRDHFVRLIEKLSQSLDDPAIQTELRSQLNAIKYWNNLLDQLPPEMH